MLGLVLVLWVVVTIAIVVVSWRKKQPAIGIVLTYLELMSATYWLPAILYILPWYKPLYNLQDVEFGFLQSFIGLLSFGVGVLVIGPFLWRFYLKRSKSNPNEEPADEEENRFLPWVYINLSLIGYFVLTPIFANVSTFSAFGSNIANLFSVGAMLAYWREVGQKNRRRLIAVTLLVGIWPLVTVAREGFLGFGLWPLLLVFTFIMRTSGRRRKFIVPVLLLIYLCLSLFVSYAQSRVEIRLAVWGGTALSNRLNVIYSSVVQNFSMFNIFDGSQLYWIDQRLSLNYLIGRSAERLDVGAVHYANGTTIADAALMLIPRIVWPDKTVVVGGHELVSEYTGIVFNGTTSVAPGQVMEFYINYGSGGVIAGFLVLGALLAVIDEGASRTLSKGNWFIFAIWVLPAISLMHPDDVLVALSGSSISSLITIVFVNVTIKIARRKSWQRKRRTPILSSAQMNQAASVQPSNAPNAE